MPSFKSCRRFEIINSSKPSCGSTLLTTSDELTTDSRNPPELNGDSNRSRPTSEENKREWMGIEPT